MAYLFGFFFGRTPLIKVSGLYYVQDYGVLNLANVLVWKYYSNLIPPFFFLLILLQLSPKKTWEGFIGGFFSTVVFGFMVRRP